MLRLLVHAGLPRIIAWVCAFLLILTADTGFSSAAPALSPEREIDLSSLGKGGVFPLARLILFVNNNTVAVAMIAQNPESPNLAHRGEPGENPPYLLRSALFDASTGRVLQQARWPAENLYRSGLIAAPDSNLLVLLGSRVALYNDKLELIKQLQLPRGGEHGWLASVSPSGRNVLFQEDTSDWMGPSTWVWVDAVNLRILHVWNNVVRQELEPISDDYMTSAPCFPRATLLPCKLLVWSLRTGPVRRLSGISYSSKTPEFVDENLLYAAMGGSYSIVDVQKERGVLRRDLGPLNMDFAAPLRAADTGRFTIPLLSIHERGSGLRYLYVLDSPTAHKRVVKLRGLSSMAWRAGWFPQSSNWLALSPDGRLLAVMENFKTLLIFKLPPPQGH